MSASVTRQRLAGLSSEHAAALWLVQRDAGRPAEAALFEEWLADSEANRAAWEAVNRAWLRFDDATDPAVAAIREEALAQSQARWKRVMLTGWKPAAVAAGVALIAVGGTQFMHSGDMSATQVAVAGWTPIRAPAEATRTVRLTDGTQMTLDAGTRVRVVMAAARREVALDQGRIWLSVAHEASRPFRVLARDRQVTAVGTRFEVALDVTQTSVALFEGVVRVDGGAKPILLRPGQQLVVQAGEPDRLSTTQAEKEALWREGLVEFDDVTLNQAVAAVNPGSKAVIRIPDPNVGRMRVSGRFRLRDSERFARSVSEVLPVRVVRVGKDAIELRPR